MDWLIFLFWLQFALIGYALAGYGLIWMALAAVFGRKTDVRQSETGLRTTMLIAARNEAAAIRAKLETVLAQDCGPHQIDVLVVSDGSQDATLKQARSLNDPRITAFQTETHGGKAAALNAGLARIGQADVVIFSDANSLLQPGALRALLAPFGDTTVGGVCGKPEPILKKGGWLARVERLFEAYDSALKSSETVLGGAVSAQGTLYAMRADLIPEQVPATMADDFYISVHAPLRGYRLVFAPGAVAREEVTHRIGDEFMRRVRSTERGWRALMQVRGLMNPRVHGLYAVQLASHKALRRLVAFLLPLFFLTSVAATGQGQIYAVLLMAQTAFYGFAVGAICLPQIRALPGAGLAAFFVMGHAAMGLGILRAAFGVTSARWSPVREATE